MKEQEVVAAIDETAAYQLREIAKTLQDGPDLEDDSLEIIEDLIVSAILLFWTKAEDDDVMVVREYLDNCNDQEAANKSDRWLMQLLIPQTDYFPELAETKETVTDLCWELKRKLGKSYHFSTVRFNRRRNSFYFTIIPDV